MEAKRVSIEQKLQKAEQSLHELEVGSPSRYSKDERSTLSAFWKLFTKSCRRAGRACNTHTWPEQLLSRESGFRENRGSDYVDNAARQDKAKEREARIRMQLEGSSDLDLKTLSEIEEEKATPSPSALRTP